MSSQLTPSYIFYAIVTLVVSLALHEFMHGYAAYLLGDTTAKDEGRLSLNPLTHIDPFMTVILPAMTLIVFGFPILAAKPIPFNPSRVKYGEMGAAILAAAGPLTNLFLAIVGTVLIRSLGVTDLSFQSFPIVFISLNVVIFVFNLVPIPPLDGSRILYAFAPEPVQDFMRNIEPYGLFIVFGLVIIGGLNGLINIDNSILNHLL
jgi:Zn-dependent protease